MNRILLLGMTPFSCAKRARGALHDINSNSAAEWPRNGSFIGLSPGPVNVSKTEEGRRTTHSAVSFGKAVGRKANVQALTAWAPGTGVPGKIQRKRKVGRIIGTPPLRKQVNS
jgi:hypothetical protein